MNCSGWFVGAFYLHVFTERTHQLFGLFLGCVISAGFHGGDEPSESQKYIDHSGCVADAFICAIFHGTETQDSKQACVTPGLAAPCECGPLILIIFLFCVLRVIA